MNSIMTLNSQIVCFIGLMVLSSTLAQFTQSPPEKGVDHCKNCGQISDTGLTPEEISICNVVVPDLKNPNNSKVQCECRKPHFQGSGLICNNVDDCAEGIDNCDNHAVCTDTEKSFTCECGPGWTGDGVTCTDINECASTPTPCGDGGSCTNTVGSYTCSCTKDLDKASDYKFYRANSDASACEDVDECVEGIDDCDQHCTNKNGSFDCSCHPGYREAAGSLPGVNCKNIDECAEDKASSCGSQNVCTDATPAAPGDPLFNCKCLKGYELADPAAPNGDCIDIDECRLPNNGVCNPSFPNNVKCENFPGGSKCTCSAGWTGTAGSCVDIDECTDGSHDCDSKAHCTNVDGSFTCKCLTGFAGSGKKGDCKNVDECEKDNLNACDKNLAICNDTVGGYTCHCIRGYKPVAGTVVSGDKCEASGVDTMKKAKELQRAQAVLKIHSLEYKVKQEKNENERILRRCAQLEQQKSKTHSRREIISVNTNQYKSPEFWIITLEKQVAELKLANHELALNCPDA